VPLKCVLSESTHSLMTRTEQLPPDAAILPGLRANQLAAQVTRCELTAESTIALHILTGSRRHEDPYKSR
jgi:hypothetical protein